MEGMIMQLLPWILIFGIMYLFFLRPQIKKQKEQNNFSANLKKGDQVATGAGMIGRITKIEDFVVELQIDSKSFVKVLKSSISKEATESLKHKNYLD